MSDDRGGLGDERKDGAEAGATTDEVVAVAGDESYAWPHQREEEPQQRSQVDESSRREALQQWLQLLEAVPIIEAFGQGEDQKRQHFWKSSLTKSIDDVTGWCQAALKNGPRLQNIMNQLVEDINQADKYLSPRQFKQLIRRALSSKCLRRALRACFEARDNSDQFKLASVSVLVLLTRDPAFLRRHLEYARGIIDRFCVVGEMHRTENAPLQKMLLTLTRALIHLCEPVPDSLCLDPLFDIIIKQTVAQAKADVSAPVRNLGEETNRQIRACALLTYCVRNHGTRLRPLLFRHGALEAVAPLAGHAEPRVAVTAVRFLHACLTTRDPHYVVALMQGNLLAPAIATLRAASCARTEVADAVQQLLDVVITADAPVAALIPHLLFPGA